MCVPMPVAKGKITDRGKITGGISTPAAAITNQMLTPFRRAATGNTLEEQRKRFASPDSMAAMLTPPRRRDGGPGTDFSGRPY